MDIASYLKIKGTLVENALNSFVIEKDVPFSQLFKAARYSLLGGGKRLRPVLTLATAEALGAAEEKAIATACALEMIHTYSLIHDDLPCMDNDDFRRGKPSLHKAYNEGHAVLTGDYLLTKAFEIIADDQSLVSDKKIALIKLISQSSGCQGMIAGQVMDIDAVGKPIGLDELQIIHRYKTGAMIQASILSGAIIGDATSDEWERLSAFGKDIGLAFQIVDDVLDVTSGTEKRGSAVASDHVNDKVTYVTLLGIDKAKRSAEELLERALSRLETKRLNHAKLKEIAVCLVQRQK